MKTKPTATQPKTSNILASLPPLVAVPGLLVGPASLLFAAAVNGGLHQARLVAGLVARS